MSHRPSPILSLLFVGLLTLGLVITPLAAQDPDFDDVARTEAPDEDMMVQMLAHLTRRVRTLEAELSRLTGKNIGPESHTIAPSSTERRPSAPSTGGEGSEALGRLLASAGGEKTKITAGLSGYSFPDPVDNRVTYHKIKDNKQWDVLKASAERFVNLLKQAEPQYSRMSEAQQGTFASLVTWGRGKIIYRTGWSLKQQELLPLDFAAALVPLPGQR